MPTRKYQMKISEPTRRGGRTVMRYRPAVDIDARHLIEGAAVFYYEHGRLPDTKVMLIEHTMETVLAKGLRYCLTGILFSSWSARSRSRGREKVERYAGGGHRITSYNVCYTKLLRPAASPPDRRRAGSAATRSEQESDRSR